MSHDSITRIVALRHGETSWNQAARIQGHQDIALNERGLLQARRLAQALVDDPLHAVHSSDLLRARQTAAAVAALQGLPVQTHGGLRERGFGVFEGLSFQEVEARWPEQAARWRQRDPLFAAEGGESLQQFHTRCIACLTDLAKAHPGEHIAVVAHGGVMDCLYRAATGLGLAAPRSWQLGNASINRLLFSGEGFVLVGWNDDHHLQDLQLPRVSLPAFGRQTAA